MPAAAIDGALHQQSSDGIDRNQAGIQHGETNTAAQIAGLGNNADDNHFRRGVACQSQLRQGLLHSGVMRCETKLSLRRCKIFIAIDEQRSWLFFFTRMNRIGYHNQIRVVQIGREIQSRCAEVENFNLRIALVEGTKHFDRQRPKAVIAKKNVA